MLFHDVSALSGTTGPSGYDIQQDDPETPQLFLTQLRTIQNNAYICGRLASPASNFLVSDISLTGEVALGMVAGLGGQKTY